MKTDGTLESKDLMIGDFVWVDHNVFEDDVYVPTKPLEVIRIEDGEAIDIAIEDCYYPIKLTPEILEKNGLAGKDDFGGNISPISRVSIYDEDNIEYRHNYFQYVHEIQHALRLCGLNDLADNFKV